MRLVRFDAGDSEPHIGYLSNRNTGSDFDVIDLTAQWPDRWQDIPSAFAQAKGNRQMFSQWIATAVIGQPVLAPLSALRVYAPVAAPEVWAAGVTYERSREARNSETRMAESVYDRVYSAARPELFFKATTARITHPGESLRLRSDSKWMVPEPELALVLHDDGEIIGYTVGNDMSSRDIEGENPLYLPQAKMFRNSCSFGPAMLVADPSIDPYNLTIRMRILRNDEIAFVAETSTKQLKRRFAELIDYLLRDNEIGSGTVLFTGTGIVPPDEFTLAADDRVEIEIPEIGVLSNPILSAL